MTMALSEALLQSTVRHQVFLEGLKSGQVNQFAAFLEEIDRSIRERLTRHDLTEFTRGRLEKLLKQVDGALGEIFDRYYDDLAGHLVDLAAYESEFEAKALDDALEEAGFESVLPAQNQIRAAVFSVPLSVRGADGGKLLDDFVKDWTSSERKRVTGAIRQGFFEGQTTFQILKNVRGTKANQYRDGILATTNRHADAIVRTAVQHAASVARFEAWKQNSNVVTGYRWVSTLDGRTSTICRTLDGQVFKIGKGPMPPAHIRCRSTTVAELDARFKFLQKGRQRASKDGPVDGSETYYSWLQKQPANFQDDVLGPVRGNLLRNGGLDAKRFAQLNLDRNFKPLTLAEMRKKEPLAFQKAADALSLTKAAEHGAVADSHAVSVLNSWMGGKAYRQVLGSVDNPRIKREADTLNLTQAERVVLRHYTGTGYDDLNRHLRGDKPRGGADSAIIGESAGVLRESLEKLPNYAGRVHRRTTLPQTLIDQHTVGAVVEYPAFTSSTYRDDDVMEGAHRFIIESVTGKKVDWISKYAWEREVLFTSPTKFVVTGRKKLADGTIEISMFEMPDD